LTSRSISATSDLSSAVDPFAHAQKGGAGLAHFERALGLGEGYRPSLAKLLGGSGQAAQRLHLIAQKDRRDRQQH
jgi:hypothetical protein